MKLTILERILLQQVLPPEGNMVTLRIVRDLRKNLGFTEEEIKKCNIRENKEKQLTQWDDEEYTAEIPIGEKAMDVIIESLKRWNGELKLTEQHIPLYEKFVEKKEV